MSEQAAATRTPSPVRGREIGAQIAGAFGTVFVWVNSTDISTVGRVILMGIALCALATIVVLSVRSFRAQTRADTAPADADSHRTPFGIAYWVVVLVEFVALIGGSRLLTAWGHPELGVAWVAVVVGTHFFALAVVFRLARFHVLAVIITALGLAGFALWLLGVPAAIDVVSGVVSGFVLIGFGLWAFASQRTRPSA